MNDLKEDGGTVEITYENNMFLDADELKGYEPMTYDIKSLGLTCFYVKRDPDLKKPDMIADR